MAGEMREATFQQLIDDGLLEIGDGYRAKNSELGGTGPIFLRAGHVTDSHIDFTNVEHFQEHLAKKVWSKMSQVGDTIITTKGNSTGRTSFVTDRLPPFVYSPHLSYWRSRDPKKLCGGFLRYWSQGVEFIHQLSGMKASTDMAPYLSLTDQRRLVITLPPLTEQKAIAAMLGALDDKIELNRRMNATLEAMARALFQSWFVDFDPVRAKLDGREPAGLDAYTAALFPAHFQDSLFGHIPKGWEISTIGTKLSTVLGGTPSREKPEYWTEGTVAWINSGKTNEFRIIAPSEMITKEALENSATKLLPRRTTVLAITGATLGQVSITEIECCANQSVVAIPASEEFPTEFIYPWIQENIEKLISSQTGGAQQHINKGNVNELVLLCPAPRVMNAYLTKAKPLFDQIAANCFQSHTLATLRDALLPKLLSGKLSVKEVGVAA